jgi:GT2 family glycosyltransferase
VKPPPLTVAVVIPTIDGRERMLARAVASVHAQRRKPDQIVIERDTERTGAAATRNRALARVEADVIAWLDDDDLLEPNHLIANLRVLRERPEVGLVYPRPRMVGGKDPTAVTYQGRFPVSPWGLRWCPEFEKHVRVHGSFIPMTHLVRTGLVRSAGGFPEGSVLPSGRYRGEDEAYLIALLDQGVVFEHLDAKTWKWVVHKRQTAGRPS